MLADKQETALARELGALFMAGFPGKEPSADILRLIRSERLGGIILFSRNIVSREQLRELCVALLRCHVPAPLLPCLPLPVGTGRGIEGGGFRYAFPRNQPVRSPCARACSSAR